ncbi:MAG TPA: DMT family transporter [Casimicrobiaceae bacterium]|nr:DMT family transporter [Casimicrobiaceae bacterium]
MPPQSVALLLVLAALWGGSFVFMRVAVPAMGPVPLTYARVALAAMALLALAFAQRKVPPFRTRWREFAVVGVVNSAIPFVLFCYAEQSINASTGAVLNATSPFFAAIAAAIWLREPLTFNKIAGMLLGLAGVMVLVGWHPGAMSDHVVLAIAACLAAAACYALAGVYTKRALTGVPTFAIACASQVTAALALMPTLPFVSVPGPVTPLVLANVAALALASTALAYLIYFKLIAESGPQRALMVTFLIPLFGVLWGALFLGEPLTTSLLTGGLLIVAGVALALRR